MGQQFNREAKEGWRFAADAARITDENASSEDGKHMSGGVFVAVDNNLGAVIGKEEAAVECISVNEGRTTQVWVNNREGVRFFCILLALGRSDRGMMPAWRRCRSEPESPDIRGWWHVTLI